MLSPESCARASPPPLATTATRQVVVKRRSRMCNVTTDRKSTRLNSSHTVISYAVFCLKKKEKTSKIQSPSDVVFNLPFLKQSRQTPSPQPLSTPRAPAPIMTRWQRSSDARGRITRALPCVDATPIMRHLNIPPHTLLHLTTLLDYTTLTIFLFIIFFFLMMLRPPISSLFPYTTLFFFFLKNPPPTDTHPFPSHAVFRF